MVCQGIEDHISDTAGHKTQGGREARAGQDDRAGRVVESTIESSERCGRLEEEQEDAACLFT